MLLKVVYFPSAFSPREGDIACHDTPAVVGEVVTERPTEALAAMAEAQAQRVQIGVGIERREGPVGHRVLTGDVAGAQVVAVNELAGDAEFMHQAEFVAERGNLVADEGADEERIVHRIPVGPVEIEFEVPLIIRSIGHAAADVHGVVQVGSGFAFTAEGLSDGFTGVVDFGGRAGIETERPFRDRVPECAEIESKQGFPENRRPLGAWNRSFRCGG